MGCSLTGYAQGVQGTKLKKQENNNMKDQKEIYFAGGCFWGTEHFLKQIRGVESTQAGYANGNIANPTYKQVCSGNTNFAETVKVTYNPQEVELPLLIDLYFKTIDPTSVNRQGNDRGSQYRTGIYYVNISTWFKRYNFIPCLFQKLLHSFQLIRVYFTSEIV